ncbi:hypothetical protein SUGI_0420560 [Cryptomeria japonica]|nr:hypothetical protein SUGI_0420560 [Cryptomeria japonica]
MEVGLNVPYELEDGELHQDDCLDHPNHVKEVANNLGKNGNKISDPALRVGGQQETLEKLSDNQNCTQSDVSTIREAGKEYVAVNYQEGSMPSLQNSERSYDYQNHIQRDMHKKTYGNDRKETGHMMISEPITHPKSWKRRYKDINHIQKDGCDARKAGNAITDIIVPSRDSHEQGTKKKKIDDSNHMGKDTYEPIEVGVDTRDMSISIRDTCKSKDRKETRDMIIRGHRKETRDMIIRGPISDQESWKGRSHADVNHLQTDGFDATKSGEAIGGIFLPEKKPSKGTSEKKSFQDSKHMEKDADQPIKAGVEFRDMRRTIRDWIDSKAEDRSIIWPPVVIIENIITGFNKTTNKWDGLKNNEIKSCLKSIKDLEYKKVMAIYNHHNGHRGSAVVIFDANETGFMNADNLSQCLQRAARGREHWYTVKPWGLPVNEIDMERWNSKGLVGDDGTRLIYGYLADPSDLSRLRSYVNRVSVESFVKKVLEPMKQRCQENEKACKDIQELEEEREQKRQALQSQKLEVNRVEEELKKKDDEVQLYRKQQDEAERYHKLKMEENRRMFDKVMKEKYLRYQQRETEIRAMLYANKIHFEKETEEYMKTENELEEGIEKEKNEQEQKRQRIVLRQQGLEKDLQAKMEKKYAELQKKLHEMKLELQAKHHKQVLELKEKVQKEKQQFLQRKLEEKNKLEKELEIARQETNKLSSISAVNPEVAECVICHTEFGPKVSRAFYEDCGHKDQPISRMIE